DQENRAGPQLVSAAAGQYAPERQLALYDHAVLLHRRNPDRPLPRDGSPYPDEELHRSPSRPEHPGDRSALGAAVCRVLDEHFARASTEPSALADAFHEVFVPIHHNDDIAAAARRGDPDRVRDTGRWLVRYGSDRCAVTVGLALLTELGTPDDIPLIRTIGLLSNQFGPLAAHALERLDPSAQSLLWLAERAAGWGRVHLVEALCRLDHPDARPWLLHKAVDGDFLNGYFAGKVAETARVHEEVERFASEPELLDHAGRVLSVMAHAAGMGTTLRHYTHSAAVLEAHVRHVADLPAAVDRFYVLATLARHLSSNPAEDSNCTEPQREALLAAHLSLLDREDWYRATRAALEAEDGWLLWFAREGAPQLRLRAFADWAAALDGAEREELRQGN
ncbi:hypothetical protein, partial [Kitasatospora sp. NPDC056531]|uniref:hypothetical protein n=1 Tax=Kitasatospora sp. NPDC056531 TaxID=3345856 RepID=UPI0036A2C76B